MRVSAKTDPGQVRLQNEDCYRVGTISDGYVWAVVCDGMGGAAGGNIASQTAVKRISESILGSFQEEMSSRSIKHMLVTALDNANEQIHLLAQSNETLTGMGTTVVAAVVTEEKAFIAHAGDSRAYLVREGELLQLTRDHSVVQVMVDHGQITEDEAKSHPRKNLITRALGVNETLETDYCEEELQPGDVILICTDGLSNAVELCEIPAVLERNGFPWLAEELVTLANENGGPDNITVVAIQNE